MAVVIDLDNVYLHILQEINGQISFFATSAPNKIYAIQAASMYGKIVATTKLSDVIQKLSDAAQEQEGMFDMSAETQ